MASTPPSWEGLPAELLIQIFEETGEPLSALSRLLQCNTILHRRLEPLLWSRRDVQQTALHWGCITGRTEPIRLAARYGAPISTVDCFAGVESEGMCRLAFEPWLVVSHPGMLTLYFAAQKKKVEAFQCLLELGARVYNVPGLDQRGYAYQLHRLPRYMCTSAATHPELARLFFTAAIDSQIKESGFHGPEVHQPLLELIESEAPYELISMCLDRGADPSRVQRSTTKIFSGEMVTPLSAAILTGSSEIFHLLVSRGANPRENLLNSTTKRAIHIPIFAAAYMMATSHSGLAMMDLCLEHGIDINSQAPVNFSTPRPSKLPRWHVKPPGYCLASPIQIFLHSIAAWDSGHVAPSPLESLKRALEQGASVEWNQCHVEQSSRLRFWREKRYEPAQPHSALQIILQDWGVAALTQPSCRSFAKLLIKHGAAKGDAAFLLKSFALQDRYKKHRLDTVEGQRVLGELLTEDLANQQLVAEATDTLCQYASVLGSYPLSDASSDIIEGLVRIGADINSSYKEPNGWRTRLPPLHAICHYLNSEALNSPDYFDEFWSDELAPRTKGLFKLLVSNGADPHLIVQRETAFEILLHRLDYICTQNISHLQTSAAILRKMKRAT